jgi:hypothetical protein
MKKLMPWGKRFITVCIAAVCNIGHDGPVCVIAAADRMITIGDIEYEPAQTKTVFFASGTVGLFAGDMQLHAAVVPKVHERIKEALAEDPHNIDVCQIADFYAEEFAYYRRSLAEREVLVPRGLNFDRFLARQATMSHYQVEQLDSRLASYHIGSTAIIAGIDPTGAHIFKIVDPGVSMCFDTPFFACAGSGEALATTQFMVGKFDKTWSFAKALWLTFSAKAKAEMSGGVGSQTDVVVIAPGERIILTDAQKDTLREIFDRALAREEAAANDAAAEIQKYLEKTRDSSISADTSTGTSQTAPPSDEQNAKQEKVIGKKGKKHTKKQE